jgi:hypothetical protein
MTKVEVSNQFGGGSMNSGNALTGHDASNLKPAALVALEGE